MSNLVLHHRENTDHTALLLLQHHKIQTTRTDIQTKRSLPLTHSTHFPHHNSFSRVGVLRVFGGNDK